MLRKVDQQENRTDWEYEGGELAIDASVDYFRPSGTKKGEREPALDVPKGKERLFRHNYLEGDRIGMSVFNPDFRFDGLNSRTNQMLRRIEFLSGLSYGIISEAEEQEKTATEVRASKDRFFTTVSDIQQALQGALEHLVASFDALADLLKIHPGGWNVSFSWDDSIVADRQREFDERLKLQNAGVLSVEENRAWYLGVPVDSEEARNVPGIVSEY